MTEVLSQDEIDALLSAISTGEPAPAGGAAAAAAAASEPSAASPSADLSAAAASGGPSASGGAEGRRRKIKIYDFKRPDKFSKDQIRTLQMIHETFARLATTALSARLRSLVHVHVGSVDQLTYEEFIKSIPNPTTLAILELAPLKGSAVFEIDPSITFAMVDRLFGGKGVLANLNRELTDIERSVVERIVLRILTDLKEAWANVIELRPRLGAMESNPQFVQIVPPNDMVVLVTLETRVGDVEGLTNLCIPYITIEPIISKLSAQFWYSSIRRGTTDETVEAVKRRLARIHVGCQAVLGGAEIRTRDFLNLQVGDVIRLDETVKEDARLIVANREKFRVRPGTIGKKLAVQVTEVLEGGLADEVVLRMMKGGGMRYG